MVGQAIAGLVAGVAGIITPTTTTTTTPPDQNKNKPEDAGEKVKQSFFEQCSEVAGLNSQVISQAVSRALPTLKSIRT